MIGSCLYSVAIASYVLAAETVILSTHSVGFKRSFGTIRSCDINQEFCGIIKEFCRRKWSFWEEQCAEGNFLFMLTKIRKLA